MRDHALSANGEECEEEMFYGRRRYTALRDQTVRNARKKCSMVDGAARHHENKRFDKLRDSLDCVPQN